MAVTEELDLATLLEVLISTSDRAKQLLATRDLDDATIAELGRIDQAIDVLVAAAEDSLDAQEARDGMAEAARQGSIPWSDIRAEFIG